MIHVTFHPITDKAAQTHIAGLVNLVLQSDGYRQTEINAREPAIIVKFEKEPRR